MAHVLILHGPNLNLLGQREPERYGTTTLQDLNQRLQNLAQQYHLRLSQLQSNAKHELLQAIQQAPQQGVQFVIINPGAFAHTSIAIRDALLAVQLPFIEVHISNIYARERFRQHSYLADIAKGSITGLGVPGYLLALYAAAHHFSTFQQETCAYGHGYS